MPKVERGITGTRTKEERIAITLEYLSSFVVWTEKLDVDELESLGRKIKSLIHRTNTENLNQFLEGCTKYISEEAEE
tara:strand:+ start:980 stop:1210 length:231 start_codon:yes stop_codon:yes gene_type:complete